MLTSLGSKQWRNTITRSIRWLTHLSKKKKMKKEIKHVKNTMITKNHYLTWYYEDISRKKAWQLWQRKEGPLTTMKALEIWKMQITDSTLQRCHDEEAIQQKKKQFWSHIKMKSWCATRSKHVNKKIEWIFHKKSILKHGKMKKSSQMTRKLDVQ